MSTKDSRKQKTLDPLNFDEFDDLLSGNMPITTDLPPLHEIVREPEEETYERPDIITEEIPKVEVIQEMPLSASLIVYEQLQPKFSVQIRLDETLIGREDPMGEVFPELDLSEIRNARMISRKHAKITREKDEFYLSAISTVGTQLVDRLLQPGERVKLKNNDIIVLSGQVAIKFLIKTVL